MDIRHHHPRSGLAGRCRGAGEHHPAAPCAVPPRRAGPRGRGKPFRVHRASDAGSAAPVQELSPGPERRGCFRLRQGFHHGVHGEPRRRPEKGMMAYRARLVQACVLSRCFRKNLRAPSWFSVNSVVKALPAPPPGKPLGLAQENSARLSRPVISPARLSRRQAFDDRDLLAQRHDRADQQQRRPIETRPGQRRR